MYGLNCGASEASAGAIPVAVPVSFNRMDRTHTARATCNCKLGGRLGLPAASRNIASGA